MNITTRTSLVIALVFVAAFKLSGAAYDNRIMNMIHDLEESLEDIFHHSFEARERIDAVHRLSRAFRATRAIVRRFVRRFARLRVAAMHAGGRAGYLAAFAVMHGLWNRKSTKLCPQFITP